MQCIQEKKTKHKAIYSSYMMCDLKQQQQIKNAIRR